MQRNAEASKTASPDSPQPSSVYSCSSSLPPAEPPRQQSPRLSQSLDSGGLAGEPPDAADGDTDADDVYIIEPLWTPGQPRNGAMDKQTAFNDGCPVQKSYDIDDVAGNEERARQYILAEHSLTLAQSLKVYPAAVIWCFVASACVIMEGYDTILIGNFFAYPAFAAKYGQFVDANGQHQLSASWQAALGNCSPVGCMIGVLLNGHLVQRLGQKCVLLASLFLLSGTIFLTFFAPNIIILMIGELLCGLPWGVFATSAPAYASEVLPLRLRGYMTSYTNMCFIIGQLIAAGVLSSLVTRPDEWSYRIPFALQWSWPALIFPLLAFAPESPWHLVRVGKLDEASKSLRRLQRRSQTKLYPGINPRSALAHMVQTNEMERRETPGTSYTDCFRGTERRRTEIACMAFAGQVLSGTAFAYNSTYFFQQLGIEAHKTYLINVGGTFLALLGTIANWLVLMPRYGRRPIYIFGLFFLLQILLAIGILDRLQNTSPDIGKVQAILTVVWTFVFQLSVGQLGWAIPAEVSSTRLRQKTVCLARMAYYIMQITGNVAQPYMLNPAQLNLKGSASLVWAMTAMLTLFWAFFRLPETKNRTPEELDWLFARKTPTRKFGTTKVCGIFGHRSGSDDRFEGYDGDAHELRDIIRPPSANTEAANGLHDESVGLMADHDGREA